MNSTPEKAEESLHHVDRYEEKEKLRVEHLKLLETQIRRSSILLQEQQPQNIDDDLDDFKSLYVRDDARNDFFEALESPAHAAAKFESFSPSMAEEQDKKKGLDESFKSCNEDL